MNCGRNATKKIIPFGFSAVTRYVFAKSRQRDPAGAAAGTSAFATTPARSSLMPSQTR
jgi:hypothetical protein